MLKPALHIAEADFAGQRSGPAGEPVSGTDEREVAKERSGVPVTHIQEVGIEHRVPQARVNEAVPDIVHVGESDYVLIVIDICPGVPKLGQTVGPERREDKQPALSQHPGDFGKHGPGIVDAWQKQIRENQVYAAGSQRQGRRIALQRGYAGKPGLLTGGFSQHPKRGIEKVYTASFESPAQLPARRAGRAAEIQNASCVDQHGIQPVENTIGRLSVDEIRTVEMRSRTIEATLQVAELDCAGR